MNLERILEQCDRYAWDVQSLDFSRPPRALSAAEEEAVVQHLTDMVGIERMAGALFAAQRRKVTDPALGRVLDQFVAEETRHAQAMQMLADHFDTRHLRVYTTNPSLARLSRYLVEWVDLAAPDIAAAAVTFGELVFDVAFVKPMSDYLQDDTATEVIDLINRDESRHIAIDYYMLDYYGSAAWDDERRALPRRPAREWAALTWRFGRGFASGFPFMRQVFFGSNELVDPDHARLKEAMRRLQLTAQRRGIDRRWFLRLYKLAQQAVDAPVTGAALRRVAALVFATDPEVFRTLFTDSEKRRSDALDAEQMAADQVAAFYDG